MQTSPGIENRSIVQVALDGNLGRTINVSIKKNGSINKKNLF